MRKKNLGLMGLGCLLIVLLSFGLSWGQTPPTMLIVVRADDNSLWKMTCDELGCSAFSSFPGMFGYQPTVTWDEATQEWVVVGTATDNSIWMATFDRQGNFNNDWQSLPGRTPSPAGVSSSLYKMGGDIKTDRWLNSVTNTFIGVGVAGAGNLTHTTYDEGWYNTAFGYLSLYSNTTGISNTASGEGALSSNTTGSNNVGYGSWALRFNTTGSNNTASGATALYSNTTGNYNTAIGIDALRNNTIGSYNIAIGDGAGYEATGTHNIYIGSALYGSAGESNVMRIGNGQTQTYISGIYGSVIGTASGVLVNSSGRLGTSASSRRFKEEISDMGESSSRLMALRPVTFRYKSEIDREERPLQYGLIAEEVAEVYPELVQYEKDGEPFTVRYHELSPMLLNEVQKQAEQIKKLHQALDEKDVRIQKLEKLLEAVQERMALIENPTSTIASK